MGFRLLGVYNLKYSSHRSLKRIFSLKDVKPIQLRLKFRYASFACLSALRMGNSTGGFYVVVFLICFLFRSMPQATLKT